MADTNIRVGIIFSDGKKFLVGHAPKKKMLSNTWDLPKGHLKVNEDPILGALREFKEETGIDFDPTVVHFLFDYPLKYNKDYFYLLGIKVNNLPETSVFKCQSYFDWFGRRLPEFNQFKYIEFDEFNLYLYKSLVKMLNPFIEKIKSEFNSFSDEEIKLQESRIFLSQL